MVDLNYSILSLFVLSLIFSCRKDTVNFNSDIVGNWTWKTSFSSSGFQKLSTDTNKIFSIQLKNDYKFVNQAGCIIGGPTEGNYQFRTLSNEKILILKAENTRPDTLKISFEASQLILTETNNGYSWHHYFSKN